MIIIKITMLFNLRNSELSQPVKKIRTRLSPEARMQEILESTAKIVANEGITSVSMEKIGNSVGISKSLVYSYFPSTTELLQALLKREMKILRSEQAKAAESANTFEQLVRKVTHVYLNYIEEKGLLIYRLQSEPSVSELGGPAYYHKDVSVNYLAELLVELYGVPIEIAKPAVDISFGLPDAAGRYLDQNDADKQTVEDITVAMILGSINAIKEGFDLKFKPLPKKSPFNEKPQA